MNESHLCLSLTGVSLPLLTVTSHIDRMENDTNVLVEKCDFGQDECLPCHKYKKYVIVTARVHPGESNSSFIMEGFLEFITG